jgi:hypothetical protein
VISQAQERYHKYEEVKGVIKEKSKKKEERSYEASKKRSGGYSHGV